MYKLLYPDKHNATNGLREIKSHNEMKQEQHTVKYGAENSAHSLIFGLGNTGGCQYYTSTGIRKGAKTVLVVFRLLCPEALQGRMFVYS